MQSILIVGLGGFTGSILRYGLGKIAFSSSFPFMTMIINMTGSFIIGIAFGLTRGKESINPNLPLLIQTGFCGGFTTFSAFSLETIMLFQDKKYLTGSSYVLLSVILCLCSAALGILAAKSIKLKYGA